MPSIHAPAKSILIGALEKKLAAEAVLTVYTYRHTVRVPGSEAGSKATVPQTFVGGATRRAGRRRIWQIR